MSRKSLATAASTAAINSGSGGSGMYSLAPAWIAAPAGRASLGTRQAPGGVGQRTGPDLEQFAGIHLGTAEHGRNLHRHVEHGFQIGGDARGVLVIIICHVVDFRRISGVEIGKRYLCVGFTHGSILVAVALVWPRDAM